jgi:hypothetical protein
MFTPGASVFSSGPCAQMLGDVSSVKSKVVDKLKAVDRAVNETCNTILPLAVYAILTCGMLAFMASLTEDEQVQATVLHRFSLVEGGPAYGLVVGYESRSRERKCAVEISTDNPIYNASGPWVGNVIPIFIPVHSWVVRPSCRTWIPVGDIIMRQYIVPGFALLGAALIAVTLFHVARSGCAKETLANELKTIELAEARVASDQLA